MVAERDEFPVPFCPPEQLEDILAHISGKHAVVMGLGLFGGGEGAARFLAERGARVTITDLKNAEQLAPALERLSDLPLRCELGGHDLRELLQADLVVVNPAVPRTSEVLRACSGSAVPLTSPMNMFLTLCPAPVIAVTGSTGKSTTAAMLAAMLGQGGRPVRLGGNIGISLLPCLGQIGPEELVVLELSSFQLEDAAYLRWSPHVAVVTNLTPNHLDRYGDFEAYAAAKRNIVSFQRPADAVVLNASDKALRGWIGPHLKGRLLLFDPATGTGPLVRGMSLRGGRLIWKDGANQQVVCNLDHVPLPGAHNVANAMAAAAAARWLEVPAEDIRCAIAAFKPLEHRMERCGSFAGMRFYNDSDSTTPESTIAALKSFDGPLTLIAGGRSKHLDMGRLAEAIAGRVEVLVTLGESGPSIAQCTRQRTRCAGTRPLIEEVNSLQEAVEAALRLSRPGSCILFSPACASYDMFQNFAERGRRFKQLVAVQRSAGQARRA